MKKRQKKAKSILGSAPGAHSVSAQKFYAIAQRKILNAATKVKQRDCRGALDMAILAHTTAHIARREAGQTGSAIRVYENLLKRTVSMIRELQDRCMLVLPSKGR